MLMMAFEVVINLVDHDKHCPLLKDTAALPCMHPPIPFTRIRPVFAPIVHYLNSLSALNTSTHRTRDLMTGAAKVSCPPTMNYLVVNVRDLALAHVLTADKDEAGGKRFLHRGQAFLQHGHWGDY